MKNKNLGISKEQLFNSINLIKEYIDDLSLETTLPENLKIVNESIQSLQPLQYLGTNANNQLGLHYFPQNSATKTGLNQVVTLSTKAGSIINVNVDGNTEKFIIQVYKYIPGESDIVEILKEFNNSDKNNFICSDNVSFNDECNIAASYKYTTSSKSSSDLFETKEISVSDFITIDSISPSA